MSRNACFHKDMILIVNIFGKILTSLLFIVLEVTISPKIFKLKENRTRMKYIGL